MKEIWKDIIGYEGLYQISNYGDVKGKRHTILKPQLDIHGYYFVNLYKDRVMKSYRIHKLMGINFIPNPNNYTEMNHIDGNKLNNHIDNLEWCTHSMNMQHAVQNGLRLLGENHHQAKLTQSNVDYIRSHYIPRDQNFGARALGRKFGVQSTQISNVVKYRTYK